MSNSVKIIDMSAAMHGRDCPAQMPPEVKASLSAQAGDCRVAHIDA